METTSTILDTSKGFGKVGRKGIICKLRRYVFSRELQTLLTDFLSTWKHWVVLNGQYFSWADITAAVPQRATLEPLLS